jgi:hypothetical protein
MREIKTFKVYNLVDAKGNKLRLNLGYIYAPQDKSLVNEHDEGLRWSFEGLKIPMPVRSGYWFNGFPEAIMLDWLKGNGWALHTIVNMFTGAARVFELPNVNKNNISALKNAESAQKMYDSTIPTALENAMKKISKAKNDGLIHCYLSSTKGKIPAEVIQSLLNAGYSIKYQVYNKGYGDCFIEAFWGNPHEKGKLFKGGSFDNPVEVSIQDYKNA